MSHPFFGPCHFRHFPDYLVGAIQRGAIRQLNVDHEIAFILVGNETNRDHLEAEVSQPHQSAVDQESDGTDAN